METNLRALIQAHQGNDPDTLTALLDQTADFGALQSQIADAVTALRSQDTFTDEDVASAAALADVYDKVTTYIGAKETAAANAEKIKGFASRVLDAEPSEGEEAPAVAPEEAPMSSGKVLERLSARTNTTTALAKSPSTRTHMIAAPDVPGMVSGSEYSNWNQMAEAAIRRWSSMKGSHSSTSGRIQAGLAVFNKEVPAELVASSDNVYDIAELAGNERRLPGGSLVAAGGWCAPSQPIYEVCEMETNDGLIDTPEIQAIRGGVIHSAGPEFTAIYSNVGFQQTEAQAISEVEKTCFEIDCPTFADIRLSVVGVCLTTGILQNAAYPEFVARFLRGAMIAHLHKMNAFKILAITTGSTAVDYSALPTFTAQGATSGLLEAIEMQVMDMRYKNRLSLTRSLEVILPAWAKGVVRADLSKRTGVDLLGVTDAMITAWGAQRGAHLQFVYDYQDAFVDAGVGMGGAVAATAWPVTVRFLVFPAGTWVAATRDIITLDAGIYDSVNITTNQYTALFSEEGIAMLKRCADSRTVTVPICPSGSTAIPVDMDCGDVG